MSRHRRDDYAVYFVEFWYRWRTSRLPDEVARETLALALGWVVDLREAYAQEDRRLTARMIIWQWLLSVRDETAWFSETSKLHGHNTGGSRAQDRMYRLAEALFPPVLAVFVWLLALTLSMWLGVLALAITTTWTIIAVRFVRTLVRLGRVRSLPEDW